MRLVYRLTGYGGFPGSVWRAADHKSRFAVLLHHHTHGRMWEYETGLATPKRPLPRSSPSLAGLRSG
ncbi:hypothetical protein [Methylobacterium sp. SyP6R]|uniref:hypothetical protein n=1 Tax=Methylobacterium sp. SyP6R TaxID=2718876 RepID=UPI001F25B58C|nr:hypothetical protein [Methylobacterium sp. SyP6R]MCF4129014.1 hypothetical protein [Methylobacterium sp. SyP6R]